MATTRTSALREHIRSSWRILLKEITAFGLIGLIALFIELGLYNWLALHWEPHVGIGHATVPPQNYSWLKAKAVAATVATTFAYFGNRHLSFSHRARTSLGRETGVFFGINLVTLLFGEAIIALFSYPLGQVKNHVVMNIVNLGTIGLGTIFRFWAYKRFVFLHPDKVHDPKADLSVELAE